jgi:hypothetical protein
MSRLARFFGAARCVVLSRLSPRDGKTDRPASSAEIVAASAFVDFGGIPSGDWLHAWDATTATNRRPVDDERLAAPAIPFENKRDGEDRDRQKTISGPDRRQYATYDFTDCEPSLFHRRDGDSVFRGREAAMLDLAMCVAAFGFVAVILLFVHPGAPNGGTGTVDAPATEVAAGALRKTSGTLMTSDVKIRPPR